MIDKKALLTTFAIVAGTVILLFLLCTVRSVL